MAAKTGDVKHRVIGFIFLLLALVLTVILVTSHLSPALLHPSGEVGRKQYNLLVFGTLLSLIVVIPVFVMTIYIVTKYRVGNKKAKYSPNWGNNRQIEALWWGIPILLIGILSVVTWNSSHTLDPYRPLVSSKKSLHIQVVALDWKWLFIYPDQDIASVNYVQLPVDTPIDFEITADAPMNSFWIPKLGGQIYAMPGMSTHLYLNADKLGEFEGSSSNISGEGFAGMRFTAHSGSETDFKSWVAKAKKSPMLMQADYDTLAKPSQNNPVTTYSMVENNLYDSIVMKYMGGNSSMSMPGMTQ